MKMIMFYVVKDIAKTDAYEYQAGPFSWNMAESYINDNDGGLKIVCKVIENLKEEHFVDFKLL